MALNSVSYRHPGSKCKWREGSHTKGDGLVPGRLSGNSGMGLSSNNGQGGHSKSELKTRVTWNVGRDVHNKLTRNCREQ